MSSRPKSHDLRRLTGIVTATPTPFNADGSINGESVAELAGSLIEAGSAALSPAVGTGEYTALSPEQRREMLELTVEAVKGAVPVIAGALSPGLHDNLAAGRDAMDVGADALMVVTPFYFKPTQDGIVDYYKRVSDTLDIDLVLYEIPYRTGVSLTAETVARLVETTRIVAMKACSPLLVQHTDVIAAVGDKIAVLTGEEDVLPIHVAMGARGGFIASSALVPRLWNEVCALARTNRLAEATALHAELRPLIAALFSEPHPAPLKAAFATLGKPLGAVLPPLQEASAGLRERLGAMLPALLRRDQSLALRKAS